jgi:hypothetical protein
MDGSSERANHTGDSGDDANAGEIEMQCSSCSRVFRLLPGEYVICGCGAKTERSHLQDAIPRYPERRRVEFVF